MTALPPQDECPRTLRDALRWAIRLFAAHQADTPRLDAELLLSHLLNTDRTQLLVRWNECLDAEQAMQFSALVRRALADEPIAYLIGERPFYDVTLAVGPGVLIPRPETELLVEEALAWAAHRPAGLRLVDVGTGSGALAIVLARRLAQADLFATDLSGNALEIARRNAQRYGVQDRTHFAQTDLLDGLDGRFDLILANLPYIDPREWDGLQASVRRYEPRLALDGGPDGTAVIQRLIAALPNRLARPGLVLLECDPRQTEGLAAAALRALPQADVRILNDLAGRARVVRIELEGAMAEAAERGGVQTRVLMGDPPGAIEAAARTLLQGGLVVFPTDTVYGIACDMRNPVALARIYGAKERPLDMAIPVLVSDIDQVGQVASSQPDGLAALAARFWPGGLTIIVPRRGDLPSILAAGGDTVAVRLPDHPVARAIIRATGGALAVTSANRSGRPSPATAQEALADLQGRVELVIDGGRCPGGVASSIVDLNADPPRLVRAGALDVESLREILPGLR